MNIKFYVIGILGFSSQLWAGTMGDTMCDAWSGCKPPSFGIGAELLVLQPDFSSLGYIGSNTTITINNYQEAFYPKSFSYEPGFKVEGFYNFEQGKDINLNYYYFHPKTSQALPNGINVYDSPFYGNVLLQLKPHWDAINLEFGNTINIDSRDKVRLHGGIQYADMALDNRTTSSTPIPGSGAMRSNQSSYSGTGVRGGADYSYNIGFGLSANFNGAATLLLGHHRFNRQYVIYTGLTPGVNGNFGSSNAIVSALEGKIGATYTYATSHNILSLNAGWMIVNYYNPIEVADSGHHGRTKESNFALSGAYVGLKWTTDGTLLQHI